MYEMGMRTPIGVLVVVWAKKKDGYEEWKRNDMVSPFLVEMFELAHEGRIAEHHML